MVFIAVEFSFLFFRYCVAKEKRATYKGCRALGIYKNSFGAIVDVDFAYRKVARSRPVYYSMLNYFGERSQYISINFPLHKQSENLKMCH